MHRDGPLSPLELAQFDLRVREAEAEALRLAGLPGGRKAHKRALRMRHAYGMAEAATRASGDRLRSVDFQGQPILDPAFRRFKK